MNDIDIANAFRAGPLKLSAGSTISSSSKSLWERMPIMIRKETKLGLAIGGVVLAVIVVWVLAVSGGDDKQKQARTDSATGGAQHGDQQGSRFSGEDQKPKVTLEPIADTDKSSADASGSTGQDPNNKRGDLDWGRLLNGDQPMLAGSHSPAAPGATPTADAPIVDTPIVDTLKTEPAPPAQGSTPVAPVSPAGPVGSADPISNAPAPANEQVAIAPQADMLRQASVAPQPPATPPAPTIAPGVDSTSITSSGSSVAIAESSAPGKQRTHLIQKNETLSSISSAAYGNPNFYPHILRANPGLDATRMKVGASIILPDVSAVKPAQDGAPGGQPKAAGAQIDAVKEYKVAANDSLYRISTKLYGKSELAGKLYELNKDQIGADPAKLKLGLVLKLPSPPTVAQSR